ncbi:phosphatidylethanolamine-binding protein [Radiomyces spectabilis]|uniref:phosphatidylethanolamine-binding protein n=1 Tax=Radiomyces spectabilis TaxID=64574 RepID=UPI00222011B0|nr:phosphatidylethanolamine-binding protein [Radiomyces spectabilis]KAI8384946.1 phosphatidylethanolamine-binding protein [Radiomyces spectabilis]
MKITYHENKLIDMGSVLLPEEVVQPPHVWFRDPQPGNHYTLAMVDADAEVPLVRHWIATNIDGSKPGTSFRDNSTLHQYTPYHGPTPPAGTGQHRYVFVLFSQQTTNQTMTPVLEDPTVHRAYFNLTQFALDNHLTPVAASYMLAEHQDGYDGGYMSRRASASAAAMKATQAPRSARF